MVWCIGRCSSSFGSCGIGLLVVLGFCLKRIVFGVVLGILSNSFCNIDMYYRFLFVGGFFVID